jgi:hypothetical protein
VRNRTCLSSYREPQALAGTNGCSASDQAGTTAIGDQASDQLLGVGRPSVDDALPASSSPERFHRASATMRCSIRRQGASEWDCREVQSMTTSLPLVGPCNATRSRRGWSHDKGRPSLPPSPAARRETAARRSDTNRRRPGRGRCSCRPTDFARRGRCLLDCRFKAARSTFRSRRLRNDGPPVSLGSSQSAFPCCDAPGTGATGLGLRSGVRWWILFRGAAGMRLLLVRH